MPDGILYCLYSNLGNGGAGGGGGRGNFFPPCWFSLNNSETIKVVTLTFCWIHSIRDIRAKFSIPSSPKSPDTGKN